MPVRFLIAWLMLCAQPALADWQFVENWTDPIDRVETRAATTTSDTGVALHIYRNPAGRVYALFTLPEGSPDFAPGGMVARITPNGFAAKGIEVRDTRGRIVEYGLSTGRMLRDRLWHGQGNAPAFGTLRDLIEAPALQAEFRLADDSTVQAQWSLADAKLPIAQALGIKIEGVAAGAQWEDAAAQSLLAAMTACQFPNLDVACVQKVTACSASISDDRDIDGFEACVSNKKTDG
jgi:hypothetical protein